MDNFYSERIVSFLSTSAPHLPPKEQDYIITNEKNVY